MVEHISKLTNQKLDPSACTLIYNKKEIDLSCPVRFANLPSGATLELRTGDPSMPMPAAASIIQHSIECTCALI
jgi:hypothetical protein